MDSAEGIESVPTETPKIPVTGSWTRTPTPQAFRAIPLGAGLARFVSDDGVVVLSAVEWVEGHTGLIVPHYHVSVSHRNQVASTDVMMAVRHDFQMEDAEEDNHGHGIVRHLWREVHGDPKECHCKNEAPPTVDGEREWRP
jgi:hypothetical protein